MGIQMRSIRDGTGVEVTLDGTVSGVEIMRASLEIYDIIPLDEQRFQIWDYSRVTGWDVSNEEVRDIAAHDVGMAEQRTSPLYVIGVQPSDLGFGLGRMYGALSDNPNWITMHFRTREEADAWLVEKLEGNGGTGDSQ